MSQDVELGRFATVLRGLVGSNEATAEKGFRFIGQAEITRGAQGEPRYWSPSGDVAAQATILELGDIVLSSMDQDFHLLQIDDSLAGSVLGRECLAVRIEGTWQPMTADFLAAWMRTENFRQQAKTHLLGMSMPRLPRQVLSTILVPHLTEKRQAEIVKLAEQFREARESVRTALAQIEQMEAIELEIAFRSDDE